EARVVAGPLADGERVAGPVRDVGQAGVGVDVEDAAAARRHLRYLAQGGVGPLAQQVVAGGRAGQRTAGGGRQEPRVDDPVAAVARAVEEFHLDADGGGVRRVIPVLGDV